MGIVTLEMRILLVVIMVSTVSHLSGCGTVSGVIQGFSEDAIDLMKFSYRVF